jgi:nicotinamide mononucleotide transporter
MYTDWKSAWNIFLNWFLSPVSALTGVICVVLCARGSWWNWTFGIVNSIAYGIIAWQTGYYGDAILNIFYFLPTQFFIMKLWEKNRITEKTDIIVMKRMSLKQIIILSSIGIIITIAFGFILSGVDHYAINVMKRNVSIYENINKVFHFPILGPMLDSSTEFFQIGAEVLLILRFAEQWVLWIATNVLTIIMWLAVIFTDKSALPYAVPTLVMWIAYLVNSVYGLYVWRKNSKGGN